MKWVLENWFLLVALAACMGVIVGALIRFVGLPTAMQREKIKQWLIWACIEAEKELQSGTGQAKLRKVWNKFCESPVFSVVAKFITFDEFSAYVKDALKRAKEMIINNKMLAGYVYGDTAADEVEKLKKQLGLDMILD